MSAKKKKKKIGFTEASQFNMIMDTNQRLNDGLVDLTKQFSCLSEQEYTEKMLQLFQEAGLELKAEELRALLKLRMKTGQMLLKQDKERGRQDESEQ